jgi:hypothetical protein
MDQPGCTGAAARLPNKPGSQKLTPPSSAMAIFGAETTVANASAANAMVGWIDDLRPNPGFLETAQLLVFMVAPVRTLRPAPDSSRDLRGSGMLSRPVGAIVQNGDDVPNFMQLLFDEHSCLLSASSRRSWWDCAHRLHPYNLRDHRSDRRSADNR